MDEIAARWNAFGWHTLVVDGHDVEALQHAFAARAAAKDQPTMILARTIKGKGMSVDRGQGRVARQGRSRKATRPTRRSPS